MIIRTFRFPCAIVFAIVLLFGCYPQGPEDLEELSLVVTNHDPTFNFQTLNTYALPDRIIKITGNLAENEDVEFIDDEYAEPILEDIDDQMQNYGWTKVGVNENPDVVILPSAVKVTNELWYYNYSYWDWWYPYYYWDWYYPYPVYGGSYDTGTIIMQMTYPDGITAADNIPVLWTGLLNGVLEGATAELEARVSTGVQKAFDQSPYLNINGQ